eukprot:scaffold80492_cov75-Cyclotella_meneghiniana.AAC.2
MSVRHSIATYLRDQGLELEEALAQSLLDSTTGRIDLDSRSLLGSCGSIDKLNFDPSPKKKFHGTITIRLKSDATLATTGTTGSNEEFLTNQYNVYTAENEIVEEPYLIPFDGHPYLSPAKPSAEALILSIHLFDFSFGVFLIARGLMSMMDQYGNLIVSLLLGTLLLSGSIAGMCWRILLSKRMSLLLLTSMSTMSSFVGVELSVGAQFTLCLLGFILSVGEVYKIMFIQYHHYSSEDEASDNDRAPEQQRSSQNSGISGQNESVHDVENENVAQSVTFV